MLEQVAYAPQARSERRPGTFTMARLVQRGAGREAGAWGPVPYARWIEAGFGHQPAAKSRKLKSVMSVQATPFKISTSDFETS